MKRKPEATVRKILSGIIMILALLWLSISAPFVFAADKAVEVEAQAENNGCEESNPFSNTTEEKNESSTSTISEYLSDLIQQEQYPTLVSKYFKCHPADIYFAFHPELVSPPPEA